MSGGVGDRRGLGIFEDSLMPALPAWTHIQRRGNSACVRARERARCICTHTRTRTNFIEHVFQVARIIASSASLVIGVQRQHNQWHAVAVTAATCPQRPVIHLCRPRLTPALPLPPPPFDCLAHDRRANSTDAGPPVWPASVCLCLCLSAAVCLWGLHLAAADRLQLHPSALLKRPRAGTTLGFRGLDPFRRFSTRTCTA
jgi:hypothetical protein